MILGSGIILLAILILPFMIKPVEHNLEMFLFIMGLLATAYNGILSVDLFKYIVENEMLYLITGAVLFAGLLFKFTVIEIRLGVQSIIKKVSLPLFFFLLIVILGLISSIISAIIAALVLVEVIEALPIKRKYRIKLCIITCFSIGLGAALTPIGEPFATIVVSELNEDFFYLTRTIGVYIVIGVIAMGFIGAIYVGKDAKIIRISETAYIYNKKGLKNETYLSIIIRAIKIFIFIMALELLGAGFRPLIDIYIIPQNSILLYWINMLSAVLDNATLAAAEISPLMSEKQVTAILMAILVSGGMLIPGNIPNIISACKLDISSKEWAKLGIPVGLIFLIIYFVDIFIVKLVV